MDDPRGDSDGRRDSGPRGDSTVSAAGATGGDSSGDPDRSGPPAPDPVVAIRRILFVGTLAPFLGGGIAFALGTDVGRGVVVGLIVAGIVLAVLAALGLLGVPLHVYQSLRE